jgi:hypothetical protein
MQTSFDSKCSAYYGLLLPFMDFGVSGRKGKSTKAKKDHSSCYRDVIFVSCGAKSEM